MKRRKLTTPMGIQRIFRMRVHVVSSESTDATIECHGSCRTPGGRRRRTKHDVTKVEVNGVPFFQTVCQDCLDVTFMEERTGRVIRPLTESGLSSVDAPTV